MDNKQFEFESIELSAFEEEVNEKSRQLIEKTIRERSPIQVGDIVTEWWGHAKVKLQVTKIYLWGIDGWDSPFSRMSFSYEGIPVKKDGVTPMKNRKSIWFNSFEINGKRWSMPSYNQKLIGVATLLKKRFEA